MSDLGAMGGFSGAERALFDAVAAILAPDIRFGCRAIRPGDRALLRSDEAISISSKIDRRRDASGAVRHVARGLLAEMGFAEAPVPRAANGAPLWPAGIVGSLAHDDEFAVALVATSSCYAGLGIDVEPAELLTADVAEMVRIDGDVLEGVDESLATRLLFAAKEAVYKSVFPRDQVILGFEDVVVDLKQRNGRTRTGRTVELAWCLQPRIVVLAFEKA